MPILCCPPHSHLRAPFSSVKVKPLYHRKMAIFCCVVHCSVGASFCSVVVQPLRQLEVPVARAPVHGVLGAPLLSVSMQPLHDVQVAVHGGGVHGAVGAPVRAEPVQPLQHVQVAVLRRTVHAIARALRLQVLFEPDGSGQVPVPGGPAHGQVGAPLGPVPVEPLHHRQVAALRRPIHSALCALHSEPTSVPSCHGHGHDGRGAGHVHVWGRWHGQWRGHRPGHHPHPLVHVHRAGAVGGCGFYHRGRRHHHFFADIIALAIPILALQLPLDRGVHGGGQALFQLRIAFLGPPVDLEPLENL
mmetsp:Transcript_14790/g.21782  ORF Transcript_14790/g.21782 Transcript_14790/m.21782 type:complete len:302 (-) Transcript_14790:952-1857(-)